MDDDGGSLGTHCMKVGGAIVIDEPVSSISQYLKKVKAGAVLVGCEGCDEVDAVELPLIMLMVSR